MKWDSGALKLTSIPSGSLQENMMRNVPLGHKTNSPNRRCSPSIKRAPDIDRTASTFQYVTGKFKDGGFVDSLRRVCAFAHHMQSSSIPNSKGEKKVRSLAALPTGRSAFCGALEDGMGEVLVSAKTIRKTQ